MNNKTEIFESLRKACLIMGVEQTPERLQLFTERLARHDAKIVDSAIMALCETERFFPSLADILKKIESPVDIDGEASEISAAIIKAVETFGPYQWQEARIFLGEIASTTADRYGWQTLCKIQNSELSIARAQLKNLAKSLLIKKQSGQSLEYSADKRENARQIISIAP